VKRSWLRVSLIRHLELLPDQEQRPRKQHRDDEQYGHEHQRETDIAAAVEQRPSHQREPRDKADGRSIDSGMKLVEDRFVVATSSLLMKAASLFP